jgi:predicted negative regulator of RcsB-dependent stress response
MDSGFMLIMAIILAVGALSAWRGLEQDKREMEEKKAKADSLRHFDC